MRRLWFGRSSQQASAGVAIAYMFFLFPYMLWEPSVPGWDRDGKSILSRFCNLKTKKYPGGKPMWYNLYLWDSIPKLRSNIAFPLSMFVTGEKKKINERSLWSHVADMIGCHSQFGNVMHVGLTRFVLPPFLIFNLILPAGRYFTLSFTKTQAVVHFL